MPDTCLTKQRQRDNNCTKVKAKNNSGLDENSNRFLMLIEYIAVLKSQFVNPIRVLVLIVKMLCKPTKNKQCFYCISDVYT